MGAFFLSAYPEDTSEPFILMLWLMAYGQKPEVAEEKTE
jgi:hypothetical protein